MSQETHDQDESALRRLTDGTGLIIAYPAAVSDRLVILRALASRIAPEQVYTEHELNEFIQKNVHPDVIDHVTVRRDLIDYQLIRRTDTGARYWRDMTSKGIPPRVISGLGTSGAPHVEGEREED